MTTLVRRLSGDIGKPVLPAWRATSRSKGKKGVVRAVGFVSAVEIR